MPCFMGYMAYSIVIACQTLLELPKCEEICHLMRSMLNSEFLCSITFS